MTRPLTLFSALGVLTLAGPSYAATINLNDSSSATTLTEVSNLSLKALRVSGETLGFGDGNRSPEVQFEIVPAGLAAGTYTVTFDVYYIDKPDQQRAAMRGGSGDGNDFDERPISNSDLSNNVDLETWYRVTAPVIVSGADPWNGTFELKPTIFGNTNDPADAFEMWIDNVDLVDGSNNSMLENGPFGFEGDTVGEAPANVTLNSLSAGQASAFEVVAIPEPGSLALAGLGVAMLLTRRRG